MLISAFTNLYIPDKSNKRSTLETELMRDFNIKVKGMLLECERLFGCVFSKAQIFIYVIFSGKTTNQTSGKRHLPFPPLGLILHGCCGADCFCYCSEMF